MLICNGQGSGERLKLSRLFYHHGVHQHARRMNMKFVHTVIITKMLDDSRKGSCGESEDDSESGLFMY